MKKILLLGAILPAFLLTGCGDGWEAKLYDGFPYGNARTAGHGIAYVRANMMPKKGPVLDAAEPANEDLVTPEPPPMEEVPMVVDETPEPIVLEEEPGVVDNLINSGEKFFRNMQRK